VWNAGRCGCLRTRSAGAPNHGGDDLDEPAELFSYCPECAEWEFGDGN